MEPIGKPTVKDVNTECSDITKKIKEAAEEAIKIRNKTIDIGIYVFENDEHRVKQKRMHIIGLCKMKTMKKYQNVKEDAL